MRMFLYRRYLARGEIRFKRNRNGKWDSFLILNIWLRFDSAVHFSMRGRGFTGGLQDSFIYENRPQFFTLSLAADLFIWSKST